MVRLYVGVFVSPSCAPSPGLHWPGLAGVLADEGGQHLHDGGVVPGGITADPLEGVDAADAHVELVRAELLDGLGVAVGHLPLAGQGEAPRREHRALPPPAAPAPRVSSRPRAASRAVARTGPRADPTS